MLIHGGFWRQRYGRELEGGIARDLVARGWAVWNIEYRRLGGGGGWPTTFEDVEAAIRALPPCRPSRGRDRPLGRRPSRRLGGGAGTRGRRGLAGGGARPRRALALGTSDNVVNQLLEGTPEEVPIATRRRPRRQLPIGLPLLVVHGERDDDVPVPSRASSRSPRERGDLVVIDDESHYEHLEPGSRCWEAVIEWLAADPGERPPSSPPIRWPASASGSCSRDAGADLPRRQLARAAACRPRATRVLAVLDEWGDRLVSGWDEWIDMPTRVGDALAEGVLGARPGEVIVCDSTTVNLFKLCSAALDAYRLSASAVVTDRDNFPTDRYVLEGLAEQRGLKLRADRLDGLECRAGRRRRGGSCCSRTSTTGPASWRRPARPDRRRARATTPTWSGTSRTRPARSRRPARERRRAGGRLHLQVPQRRPGRAGVPVRGRGGPAAPALADPGLVRPARPVRMDREYDPVDGIGRFLAGTPPMLASAAVEEGVSSPPRRASGRLREKSLALCELIIGAAR